MTGCGHDGAGSARICPHLLARGPDALIVRFTGRGAGRNLVCLECAAPGAALVEACLVCVERVEGEVPDQVPEGIPGVVESASALRVEEETITLDERPSSPVIAVSAATGAGHAWFALTGDGQVGRLDLPRRALRAVARLPEDVLGVGELALEISADGKFAAIVNARGRTGVVLDLDLGCETMRLDRGEYHETVSAFPVAFVVHRGRTLLVHGTAWNRLDVSDPATGELRTARGPMSYETGDRKPEHYLDYFHAALSVSPTGEWIAEDGWMWQPAGATVSWSLARWLDENPFESEDGPTRRHLGGIRDFWDAPAVWLSDEVLGIWGGRYDSVAPRGLLERHHVRTGERLAMVPCPEGVLVAEGQRLFVFGRETGLSVLDASTGDRLLHRPDVIPTAHRGGGEFLTLLPGGGFRVSRVLG